MPTKPLAGLGEAAAFCKRLWRKDPTPFNGQVFFGTEEAVLNYDPIRSDIPLLIGAWGPKAAQMAGAQADGMLAYAVWRTPYVKRIQAMIAEGAGEKGRDPDAFSLDLEPIFHIDEDAELAKDRARSWLADTINILTPMTDFIDPELFGRMCKAIAVRDIATAKSLITDEILDEFALYGTPHQVIEKIERKQSEVGLKAISLGLPFETDRITNYMHLAGKYVLPHFQKKGASAAARNQ